MDKSDKSKTRQRAGLTSKAVEKLVRNGVVGRHFDGNGLYLIVTSPTAAFWERRYKINGTERYMGLGGAKVFGLAKARERNRAVSEQLADKIDPLVQRRAERAARAAEAAAAVTFGVAAQRFYDKESPGWKHRKHHSQFLGTILGRTLLGRPAESNSCKQLRALPVRDINVALVMSVLQPLADRPETRNRVRARIASVLDFSTASGWRTGDNPAAQRLIGQLVSPRSKVAPVKHFAAVRWRELPAFMAALRARPGTAAAALQFLILTASRSAETLGATWDEIDFENRTWTIPANRMKAGKEHRVPLADEVVALLKSLPTEQDNPHLFVGREHGKPLSGDTLVAVVRSTGRAEAVHGFRSTFADWSHESTATENIIIEMALAHAVGSAVERAYRRTDLLAKRARHMEKWATFCTSPVVISGDVVVPLKQPVR